MDNVKLTLFLVLVFASVFLLTRLVIGSMPKNNPLEKRELKKRLESVTKSGRVIEDKSLIREQYLQELSPIKQFLVRLPVLRGIDELIIRSGKNYTFNGILSAMVVMAVTTGIIINLYADNILLVCAVILISSYLPILKLQHDRNKRLALFESQLPDALDTMTRGLRSGYPFNEAMQYISKQMSPPLSYEFGITFEEINYGRDIRLAFTDLMKRVPSINLIAVVTAILIQQETGGNLAELLDQISSLLRKRIRFERSIQTLTAEARLSAWFLGFLPVIVGLLIMMTNPDFIAPLFNTDQGHTMIKICIGLETVGAFWMYKLINLNT